MPNHITTIITAETTEDLAKVVELLINKPIARKLPVDGLIDTRNVLTEFADFNKVIPLPENIGVDFENITPQPKELDSVTCTAVTTQIEAVGLYLTTLTQEQAMERIKAIEHVPYSNIDALYRYNPQGNNSLSERLIREYTKQLGEKLIGNKPSYSVSRLEGETYRNNAEQYGYFDWYNWRVDNWGTKWNAYDTKLGPSYLSFDTAWSHPTEIIVKVSKLLPDTKLTVMFADENLGYNCGRYDILNGNYSNVLENDDIENHRQFAADVLLVNLEDFDNEE